MAKGRPGVQGFGFYVPFWGFCIGAIWIALAESDVLICEDARSLGDISLIPRWGSGTKWGNFLPHKMEPEISAPERLKKATDFADH